MVLKCGITSKGVKSLLDHNTKNCVLNYHKTDLVSIASKLSTITNETFA
jgi:hypothetical protein